LPGFSSRVPAHQSKNCDNLFAVTAPPDLPSDKIEESVVLPQRIRVTAPPDLPSDKIEESVVLLRILEIPEPASASVTSIFNPFNPSKHKVN
jgi:hypothetical protein